MQHAKSNVGRLSGFRQRHCFRASPANESGIDEAHSRQRIEAKGYSKISGLQKDSRRIWRGNANPRGGQRVQVSFDLEGNIYSEVVPSVEIWFRNCVERWRQAPQTLQGRATVGRLGTRCLCNACCGSDPRNHETVARRSAKILEPALLQMTPACRRRLDPGDRLRFAFNKNNARRR